MSWLFQGALVEHCNDGTWRVGATRVALVLKVDGEIADISITRIAAPDVVKRGVSVRSLRKRAMWKGRS